MTDVRCPTCDRMLLHDHGDGSFDLAADAEVAAEYFEPIDGFSPEDAGKVLPLSALPMSARCLRCHPRPAPTTPAVDVGGASFEVSLPPLPLGATGWDIYSSHQVPVFAPLRGWRRLWARLRGRPLTYISGWREVHAQIGAYRVGEVPE